MAVVPGGLAIYWRKDLAVNLYPVFHSNRILGLKVRSQNVSYLLINVYMPCDYRDAASLLAYRSSLAELSVLIDNENADEIFIAGDLNCDPTKGRFYTEFSQFNYDHNLHFIDSNLPRDSFTYMSAGQNLSTSWLDHAVTSNFSTVNHFKILYGLSLFDHIPIEFEIFLHDGQIGAVNKDSIRNGNIINEFVLWNKITNQDILIYQNKLKVAFQNYTNEALMCTNSNCNLDCHIRDLDDALNYLYHNLHACTDHLKKSQKNKKFTPVAGWNDYCRNLYCEAKNKFLEWKLNGKIRNGNLYNKMKQTRANFKSALKYCRRNE